MSKLTLQTLGRKLSDKRGKGGVRKTAEEIGINHSTLLRIENGHLPDLETFRKVCIWLEVDPGEVLGFKSNASKQLRASAHFRKDQTLKPDTAQALADLILSSQRALMAMENE